MNLRERMSERLIIEEAIYKAIQLAWEEKIFLDSHYTEENFRYLVMYYISKIGLFGQFPNNKDDSKILTFEYQYSSEFKPDIVSLNRSKKTKTLTINKHNPLVIELKINGSLFGKKSSIQRDIKKIKTYMHKAKGEYLFEYGMVLNLGLPKNLKSVETYSEKLEKLLNYNKFNSPTKSSYNLLFGWFNPIINKPEVFWLEQSTPIRLGV